MEESERAAGQMDKRPTAEPRIRRELREVARRFRNSPTRGEDQLWQALRNRKLDGWKFRRQHPIRQFIVDFYCPDAGLVVEIDGPIHKLQAEHDHDREEILSSTGLRVLRVKSEDVEANMNAVLEQIRTILSPSPPAPLPLAGEG